MLFHPLWNIRDYITVTLITDDQGQFRSISQPNKDNPLIRGSARITPDIFW
jgi:hypothetical protein